LDTFTEEVAGALESRPMLELGFKTLLGGWTLSPMQRYA
jgi:hypothetical protein